MLSSYWKKKWHPISACSSLFVYYLQKTFWHNMHSFSMFFSPSFLAEPCCYDKISLPHYCPLSSLIRLASCHVIPVEVSPVWSRSHIHKVLSPELFKNITKSHTPNYREKERPFILSIQKSIQANLPLHEKTLFWGARKQQQLFK